MDLVFPVVLYVGVPLAVVLLFVCRKKKTEYKDGVKVANTTFIEEVKYCNTSISVTMK